MTTVGDRQIAANYMGAVAHLLSGRPGRHPEFIRKVELILSANEPHAMQLMIFAETVRRTGRPVIWICHSQDAPNVPSIGLVALVGDQPFTIENCMLWMSATGDRACLIPDNFKFGAFKFDDDLRLRHMPKSPARDYRSATSAMSRAYGFDAGGEDTSVEPGDDFYDFANGRAVDVTPVFSSSWS